MTNDAQSEYWNSDAARPWVERAVSYDAMLAPFLDLVFGAAAPRVGERALDVGCGSGALSRAVAVAVGKTGAVTGVDISAQLLGVAQARASLGGFDLSYLRADAQTHAFAPGTFDLVVSRFGVMFFADPVAAFTNLRRATRDGGRLAFCCWQSPPMNDWVWVPMQAVASVLELPPPPADDEPGPFAFADDVRVRGILESAGWTDVHIEPALMPIALGGGVDLDRAVDFYINDGMGRRFLTDATDAEFAAVADAVRNALAPFADDGPVVLESATWLVRATAARVG